jgi:hypothetical protein
LELNNNNNNDVNNIDNNNDNNNNNEQQQQQQAQPGVISEVFSLYATKKIYFIFILKFIILFSLENSVATLVLSLFPGYVPPVRRNIVVDDEQEGQLYSFTTTITIIVLFFF